MADFRRVPVIKVGDVLKVWVAVAVQSILYMSCPCCARSTVYTCVTWWCTSHNVRPEGEQGTGDTVHGTVHAVPCSSG